jgi:hypothetical protein
MTHPTFRPWALRVVLGALLLAPTLAALSAATGAGAQSAMPGLYQRPGAIGCLYQPAPRSAPDVLPSRFCVPSAACAGHAGAPRVAPGRRAVCSCGSPGRRCGAVHCEPLRPRDPMPRLLPANSRLLPTNRRSPDRPGSHPEPGNSVAGGTDHPLLTAADSVPPSRRCSGVSAPPLAADHRHHSHAHRLSRKVRGLLRARIALEARRPRFGRHRRGYQSRSRHFVASTRRHAACGATRPPRAADLPSRWRGRG